MCSSVTNQLNLLSFRSTHKTTKKAFNDKVKKFHQILLENGVEAEDFFWILESIDPTKTSPAIIFCSLRTCNDSQYNR